MKIDFDGVQAFVAVAELGGFGKAASHLNLTQTALTRRVQKLEGYLGVRLLDRTTRSVSMTPVGTEFLPQAQRIVTDLTATVSRVRDASRSRRGDLTIGCIPSMAYQWLPAFIRRYAEQYPGNRIRILDLSASLVVDAVLHAQAEFGVTILMSRHAELAEQPIMREPFALFCRDDHALSRAKSVTWGELDQEDLIVVSSTSGNRALLDYQLARHRINVNGMYEVHHPSTALGLVTAGVGTAILPVSTIQEGTHPRVRRIPLVRPAISRTIALIRRRRATLSPAAQAFYEMLALAATAPEPAARRKAGRRAPRD
jgi:DNA-binding transcriptional LysR family regulator